MSNKDVIFVAEDTASLMMVPVKAVTSDLVTEAGVIVYTPLASTKNPGIVQVGNGLKITDNGVLSVDEVAISSAFIIKNNDYVVSDITKIIDFGHSFVVSRKEDSEEVFVGLDDTLNYLIDNYHDDYTFLINSFSNYYDKTYIDDSLNNKLDKVTNAANRYRAYVIKTDGSQDVMNITTSAGTANAGFLATYFGTSSGTEQPLGRLITNDPLNDYHAVNLKHVNGLIVDDLETEDASKLLSANQGVILKDMILEIPHAKAFDTISEMVSILNGAGADAFLMSSTIRIVDTQVPDFWISGVDETYEAYDYVDDDSLIAEIDENKRVKIGFYKISKAEVGKIVLDDYLKKQTTALDSVYAYSMSKKTQVMATVDAGNGLALLSTNALIISPATKAQIDSKTADRKPLTPTTLDYAVKVGVTTNTETLTDDEKTAAQNWLGVTQPKVRVFI